ncbi:MAG: type II toxin-antitoxin system PemK/MazF family toxin [Propionibacteriaceae bacterium]|jgi:mRNA-degrading endonuclease toxin of MazEF toxin-antitoxin module|nr:type II toxin-antitoxin system PemK/MazF family toxin [Propionibacteriaceae bacterium]
MALTDGGGGKNLRASRGEVWLAQLGSARDGELGKNRPVVVLSIDKIATGEPDELVIVVPVTSSPRSGGFKISLGEGERLSVPSVALSRSIRAIARSRLLEPLGRVSELTLFDLTSQVAYLIGHE